MCGEVPVINSDDDDDDAADDVTAAEPRHDAHGCERQIAQGARRVCACAALLPATRSGGTQRPDFDVAAR